MGIRSVYSTNGAMDRPSIAEWGVAPNSSGCAVAIGSGPDGRYSINVVGFGPFGSMGSAYALIDRQELRQIHDAISRELADG